MSDLDDKTDPTRASDVVSLPPLRREALLPSERGRGLGTVAVVCTMAGIASGLALATTLMAMQVADNMSAARGMTPHAFTQSSTSMRAAPPVLDHGFLGIRFCYHDGSAEIDRVLPGTPAAVIGLHPGDKVLAIDGNKLVSGLDLQQRIFADHPGYTPLLEVERVDGTHDAVAPTLIAWPSLSY